MRMIQECLGDTPPDLSQDVSARGITLVGGQANLQDIGELVATSSGVEVNVASQADLAVIRGSRPVSRRWRRFTRSFEAPTAN